jgi:Flp pilus assembly protein TadB
MISWHVASKYALGFIALLAVIGVVGAVSEGRYGLAAVVGVTAAVGIPLAHRKKRLRKSLEQPLPPGKSD